MFVSTLAALCCAYWGLMTGLMAWLALVGGYASHLLADMATPHGIPLLYPQGQRWHLLPRNLRIATASPEEDVVFAISACGALVLFLALMRNPLMGTFI